MTRTRFALLLLLALSLPGCFDITEDVWVEQEGTARLRVDFGLGEALTALGASPEAFADLRQRWQDLARELAEDREKVVRAVFEENKVGERLHFVIDVRVTRDEYLDDVAARIAASGRAVAEKSKSARPPAVDAALRLEPQGTWSALFVCALRDPDRGEGAGEDFGRQLLKVLWGDRAFTLRVHAPVIESAEGTIDEARETVEWQYPMLDVMTGAESVPPVLRATVRRKPGLAFWGGILLGAVVLLAVVRAATGRRRA